MFRPLQSYPYISYTIFIEMLLLYFVCYIHGYMKSQPTIHVPLEEFPGYTSVSFRFHSFYEQLEDYDSVNGI